MSRILVQCVQFAGVVVLARLLSPSAFGLVAMIAAIGNFAALLADLGVGASLVRAKNLGPALLDTAFWMNALGGVVLFAALAALATPISLFYGEPRLIGLTIVMALTYVVSLSLVPLAILERGLQLRGAGAVEVGSAVGSLGVGIALAAAGTGPYALVIMQVTSALLQSIGYLALTGYRPRGWIRRAAAKEIWSYSGSLVGSNIANYLSRNSDDVLLGRFSGSSDLGYYNRAFALMLLPVAQVQQVIGRVLFPALSQLSHDRPRLRAAHREALLKSTAICAPLAAGMAACSPDLVQSLFGPSWRPMIPVLAILASTGVQQVIQGTTGIIYQVTDNTPLMFRMNLGFAAVTVMAFAVGVHWGALGLATAVAIRGWSLLPLSLWVPFRKLDESLLDIGKLIAPVLGALLLEVVAVQGAWALMSNRVESSWVRLSVEVLVGAAAYGLGLSLLARQLVLDMLSRGRA